MIGAGGQAGQGDAANLLKPALARGELRTIAATTWSEYKKYFEKDAALARRFQVVKVEEPSETQCVIMMRGLVAVARKASQRAHPRRGGLRLRSSSSHRFLAGRQLPDKAVSILDTACARLALGQNTTPPAIEDLNRTIDALEVQTRILNREESVGADHQEKLAELAEQKGKGRSKARSAARAAGTRNANWSRRSASCAPSSKPAQDGKAAGARCGRAPVEQNGNATAAQEAAATPEETKAQLQALEAELSALQGETG